jgi:hypothetical protein
MSRFAQNTSVPVERSRAEIERTLLKYGALKFGTWSEPGRALIQFELKAGRSIQIPLPLPVVGQPKVTGSYPKWSEKDAEQETRRRWRVLLLTLKALLEGVESKLMTIDQAFLAYVVVPGTARTIGDQLIPKLDALYAGTWNPQMLLGDGR